MNNLPNEAEMLELLKLANQAEQKLKALSDSTLKIDEKWRDRLESRKHLSQQSNKKDKAS